MKNLLVVKKGIENKELDSEIAVEQKVEVVKEQVKEVKEDKEGKKILAFKIRQLNKFKKITLEEIKKGTSVFDIKAIVDFLGGFCKACGIDNKRLVKAQQEVFITFIELQNSKEETNNIEGILYERMMHS